MSEKAPCRHTFVECKGPAGHGGRDGKKPPPGKWMVSCPGCSRVFSVESSIGAALYAAKAAEPMLVYVWRGGLKWYWAPQFTNLSVEDLLSGPDHEHLRSAVR